MKTIKEWGEKNLVAVHVLAAAALLAVALVEIVPELVVQPLQGVRQASAGMPLRPVVPSHEPLRAAPLSTVATAPAKAPFSLDEFMGLLEKTVPPPLARKFAKSFVKETPLRNALEQYRRERGGKGPAGVLLNRLARIPKFRHLVNQFRGESGSQGAFLQLARNPEVNALLRGMAGGAASGAAGSGSSIMVSGAGNARASGAQARQSSALASRQGVSGALTGSQLAGRGTGFGAASSGGLRDAVGASPIAGAPGGAITGGGAGPVTQTSGATGGSQGETGSDALNTLGPLTNVEGSRETGSFLDSLFATAPRALRDAVEQQCEYQWEMNGSCDLVQACVAANLYEECAAACRDNSVCSGQGLFSSTEKVAARGRTGIDAAGGVDIGPGQAPALFDRHDFRDFTKRDVPLSSRQGADTGEGSDTDWWALGPQIALGTAGAITGAIIGAAIGGPAGTILGGALGGALGTVIGSFIGDALSGFFS